MVLVLLVCGCGRTTTDCRTTAPDLHGMDYVDVVEFANKHGIILGHDSIAPEDIPNARIVKQTPPPGTEFGKIPRMTIEVKIVNED